MGRSGRSLSDPRKRTLRAAEEDLVANGNELSRVELARIGVVWSGILGIDDHVPPATVAAMLSSSELVIGTSTVSAQENWINAAAYAAMAANSEHYGIFEEKPTKASKATKPIKLGFSVEQFDA